MTHKSIAVPYESLPETTNTQSYYKGKNSLYKFAEEWGLNSYEFDQIKRIVRCRHKGNFVEDLNKTKDLIDIYLKEQGDKYEECRIKASRK